MREAENVTLNGSVPGRGLPAKLHQVCLSHACYSVRFGDSFVSVLEEMKSPYIEAPMKVLHNYLLIISMFHCRGLSFVQWTTATPVTEGKIT